MDKGEERSRQTKKGGFRIQVRPYKSLIAVNTFSHRIRYLNICFVLSVVS